MVKSIVVNNRVVIVSQIFDIKKMSIEDFIKLRISMPDIYWHFVLKNIIPEEVIFSVEIEFDD